MSQTPSAAQLFAVLDRMPSARVLLLADLVLDRFIIGRPTRVSREAPVLILHQEEVRHTPGGGGNAAMAVASLDAAVSVIGALGDDAEGEHLRSALEAAGIDLGGVRRIDGYSTPTKTRVVGRGEHAVPQQIVRFDRENRLDDDFEVPAIDARPQVALISDYGYGAATPATMAQLRSSLPQDVPILVDSRYRLNEYANFTAATPNQEEAERLLGRSIEQDPAGSARQLRDRLGCDFLLLTRGSEGMIVATGDGEARIPPHGSGEVADVTGAGDTVIGTLGTALAAGASPVEASLLANYAGGVVVTRAGTASVERCELTAAVERDPTPIENLEWTSR